MTIDIWLVAAAGFFIVTLFAIMRIFPGPTLNDRLIAVNVATTLGCAGSLALAVAVGSLFVVLAAGLLACIVFATTIRISQRKSGAAP